MQSDPALIVIRGNSGSGKTTVAHEIRSRYGDGLAIVSQDVVRRDILKVKDRPGNPAIGLIDQTARYALDHGYHVIVEGILYNKIYGEMLTRLVRDHRGLSACFYYDLDFEDTVRRHATKAKSTEFGPDLMADWFRLRDLVPALNESILGPEVTLDAATSTVMRAVSLREVEKGADQ